MSALALPLLVLMLVWLVYTVTTYALPCLIGLVAARVAFETGAGWIGALFVFGLTALVTFGVMRWLFTIVKHSAVRVLLAIAFVAPAVVVSYFILNQASEGHIPSELWRQTLCVVGAGLTGLMAFVRLAEPEPE